MPRLAEPHYAIHACEFGTRPAQLNLSLFAGCDFGAQGGVRCVSPPGHNR
jgi:hypothetical protein